MFNVVMYVSPLKPQPKKYYLTVIAPTQEQPQTATGEALPGPTDENMILSWQ